MDQDCACDCLRDCRHYYGCIIFDGGRVNIDASGNLSASLNGIVVSIEDDAGGNTLKAISNKAEIDFSKGEFEHIDQEDHGPPVIAWIARLSRVVPRTAIMSPERICERASA